MSGGGGTTTSNSSTTVPPQVLAEYQNVTNQANQVASTPLNQYGGQIVAGTTPNEQAAYNEISNMQGISSPYTTEANNYISQATQNINPQTVTAAQIQGYESPYTQNVLNTTVAEENNQDAQQQAQLQGNAISSGAWGGDRAAVAQGILGGQQTLANNATNAGIENTGYTTAEQEANTQQQAALGAQEASQYLQESGGLAANQLGTSALNNSLTGANALYGTGYAQQQQAQAELNVPYEQFLQTQSYPFQTTGWLGNIAEGLGSNSGGSTTSSTTQPSQGLFKRGGGITGYATGGTTANSGPEGVIPGFTYTGTSGTGSPYPGYEITGPNGYGGVYAPLPTSASAASTTPSIAPTTPGAFTAQKAPTYQQFAASNGANSGAPYTGGIVKGLNSANQADLNAIYNVKAARGGGIIKRASGGSSASSMMPSTQAPNSLLSISPSNATILGLTSPTISNPSLSTNTNSTSPLSAVGNFKKGGIVPHRDAGGSTPLTQGVGQNANPFQNNVNSNYSQMSLQQLQQLAQRLPPGTPQGQAVQAALKQKQYLPNVGGSSGVGGMARGGIIPHFDDGGGQGGGAEQNFAMEIPTLEGPQIDGSEFNAQNAPAQMFGPNNGMTNDKAAQILQTNNGNTSNQSTPTPPVNAPDHPDNKSNYSAEMPSDHAPNPWLSVAAGVLGTLAGRSRNPLVDIGQGGLIGLNNYAGQIKTAEEQNYQEGNFHQNAQKLMDESDMTKKQFAEEQLRDANTASYQRGELANQSAQLQQGRNEVIKDVFGNPTGTFNKTTGKFTPMDPSQVGGSGSNVVKDVDGTPLTGPQLFNYKNLITKQQPKDLTTENTVLPSLLDQKTKVDDLVNQIPVASSGSLHTLADFADRNQIPIFSDPVRAKATVEQNYDSLGNVLDNIKSTFGGTGRVLSKEFDALKNELSVNASASPEQKAVIVGKVQSRLNDLIDNETQRAQDIRSGKAYLPSYQSPEQQKLAKIVTANQNNSGTPTQSSIIRYDANGNRIQ